MLPIIHNFIITTEKKSGFIKFYLWSVIHRINRYFLVKSCYLNNYTTTNEYNKKTYRCWFNDFSTARFNKVLLINVAGFITKILLWFRTSIKYFLIIFLCGMYCTKIQFENRVIFFILLLAFFLSNCCCNIVLSIFFLLRNDQTMK